MSDTFPMSDSVRMKAALEAARRARAIAVTREFDDDAVRLVLERAERELHELLIAASLREPEQQSSYPAPQMREDLTKAA